MIDFPTELAYLRRYLTPEGEMVCRPEAARKLLEATNDDSDYIAPEMAKWVLDLGAQMAKPKELARDNCPIVFSESELIQMMPKELVHISISQKGQKKTYVKYELCLMNRKRYVKEHGLDEGEEASIDQFYYFASYKRQKKKSHIHEFGPMANRAELLAKMLTYLIEEEEVWVMTDGTVSRITGFEEERDNPNGVWEDDITGFSFD